MKKRLYIAGAISSTDTLKFLNNIRRGVETANAALEAGYAVFSPHIDFQLFLGLKEGQAISVNEIRASSMAWMEVADAVLVAPRWQNSKGTKKEIKRAEKLGIPVYFHIEELLEKMPA